MTFLVSHDIPLSRQTVDAWKGEGGLVLKRHTSSARIEQYIDRHLDTEFVLNLGSAINADIINPNITVINPNRVVQHLWDPVGTRAALDSVLPPIPPLGHRDFWYKTTGRAGMGKLRITDTAFGALAHSRHDTRRPGDFQVHVEGTEYRVITVGGRIVQQFLRSGPNGDRTYRWLERAALPNLITDVVARATRDLGTYTLIAWDTIHDAERGYILEGNCCPGVKPPTAARIVSAVRRLINAER